MSALAIHVGKPAKNPEYIPKTWGGIVMASVSAAPRIGATASAAKSVSEPRRSLP
jgi:hypothetical protein